MAELRSDIFQATTGVAGIEDRDVALASRMVDQSPGIIGAAGYMNYRGANTLIKGGRYDFLDPSSGGRAGRRATRLQNKFRVFDSSSQLVAPSAGNYVGGYNQKRGLLRRSAENTRLMRRAEAKSAAAAAGGFGGSLTGASNFQFRGTRVNYLTANPKALGRYHSASVFTDQSAGAYSPFALSTMIGRSEKAKTFFNKRFGLDQLVKSTNPESILSSNQSIFGPGLMSFISAGRKADVLETKALKGNKRAMKKLATMDKTIESLSQINNPAFHASRISYSGTSGLTYNQALNMTNLERGGLGAQAYLDKNKLRVTPMGSAYDEASRMMIGGGAGGQVGIRGNMMASSMAGAGTRYAAGYFRGALGKSMLMRDASGAVLNRVGYQAAVAEGALVKGLFGEALAGSQAAIHTFGAGLEKAGIKVGSKAGAEAAEVALEKGVFKTLGKKGVMKAVSTKEGAKVLGARALGLALPGINLVMMASLVYDLGQMAGEVVKSGINLAKDANKSLQGSINKPLFGMGYKDTEAAATSRARGVMAIQNSRLNARSMLGSEASMMAAHYG